MKSFALILLSVLIIISKSPGDCAKILFYFGMSTFSHRIAVWPLVEALVENGHNVTFLSTFSPLGKHPKVTEVWLKNLAKHNHGATSDNVLQLRLANKRNSLWSSVPQFAKDMTDLKLKDPDFLDFFNRADYDLVFLGAFFNELGLFIAHKMNAKVILFSPTTILMFHGDMFGHIPETSSITETDLQFQNGGMAFLERVHNTLSSLYWHLWMQYDHYPTMEKIIQKHLNLPEMPSLAELWRKTSLVMLNTHPSFEVARTLPPLYISVGGLHIQPSNGTIPKDMLDFIESSESFIYVSFGSFAKASMFPPELLQVFCDTFRSFPNIPFIWVFDSERPKEMPDNVFTVKWAPQYAILAHKKIKTFITQAGAMSTQESVHFAVPTILFPLMGDQDNLADHLERKGCGIKLEIRGLVVDTFQKAIANMLNDNRYKQRILEVSAQFKDRQSSPLETAVWWTEFVLRNNNTDFLKPLAMSQTWIVMRLLDVWLFLFSIMGGILLSIAFLVRKIIVISRRDNVKVSRSNKLKKK